VRPFAPRRDILPLPQARLWPELAQVPEAFTLYGGTALALQRGHRQSVDFGFFSNDPFAPLELQARLEFLRQGQVIQAAPNTLSLLLDRGGPVKLSFFGGLEFGRVDERLQSEDGVLRVASLADLCAAKLAAILARAETRDYADLAEMLRAGLPLARGLGAALALRGGFPVAAALRALAFFTDLDPALPPADQQLLLDALRGLPDTLLAVPLRSPRIGS
jgi:hypothetical protein